MNEVELAKQHSWFQDLIFKIKVTLFIGKRFLINLRFPLHKFSKNNQLVNESIIAISESELWNSSDNGKNWSLTAGKVENLRIAARNLNGIEVKAGKVFSFWKHLGNPNWGKGYVTGREVREGCIIPTKAGGLCQLSNALYDAALKADFDIIERHKHTQVIKGSLAEKDRDATVKWNYVDLKFKSSFDFRIEIELTSNELIVSYKSTQKNTSKSESQNAHKQNYDNVNDCYSCGNLSCFKNEDQKKAQSNQEITTFILDEKWPEFDDYVTAIARNSDCIITPINRFNWIKTNRYAWSILDLLTNKSVDFYGLYRVIKLRQAVKRNQNIFEKSLELDRKVAKAISKQIPIETTHVIVSQNLLPFIYETGILGGRTFDVLMTRFPIRDLQERLDHVYERYPQSPTLKDFRADSELITLENKALLKARTIITPHSGIAKLFGKKAKLLNWALPKTNQKKKPGNKVLFPASMVGRKGAYEMRRLNKELDLNLSVLGGAIEEDGFLDNQKHERFDGSFDEVMMVVYPTYVEHQPRQILIAISKGIPVVTTKACGLEESDLVTIVDMGDYDSLKREVQRVLHTIG